MCRRGWIATDIGHKALCPMSNLLWGYPPPGVSATRLGTYPSPCHKTDTTGHRHNVSTNEVGSSASGGVGREPRVVALWAMAVP
eukprot:SAG11_NODE_245_length_11735_cov_3.939068_3_plen_84_part_00